MKAHSEFKVLISDCNQQKLRDGRPMVFGGAVLAQLDLVAAIAVKRALVDSECDSAVTHKVDNVVFHRPVGVGDLVVFDAEVLYAGGTFITVEVKAYLEEGEKKYKFAESMFTFVSKKNGEYRNHNLKNE